MVLEYKPNEDMQTILDFLDDTCTMKEHEHYMVIDALNTLKKAGWKITLSSHTGNCGWEIKAYNKFKYHSDEDREKYGIKYCAVVLTENAWKIFVAYLCHQHMDQMKLKHDTELRVGLDRLMKNINYEVKMLNHSITGKWDGTK